MGLVEYVQFCCTGQMPKSWQDAFNQGGILTELLKGAAIIGALEPLCATRPGVCDPVAVVDRTIPVAPATIVDGKVVPTEERVISICAPMNRALVVDELRVLPANLTATTQGANQPEYKRVNLASFGEWCLPFEPEDRSGQFVNVEHVIVPPKAGYSVFVSNDDPFSEALYQLRGRMWACS
jgi:hypothetical protein